MKKITLIAAVLLIALSLIACSNASAGKVYGKDDSEIAVEAGKTFVIQLDENPDTGYAWTVSISDNTVVSLENEKYEQTPVDEGVVGAGGVKALTLKGLKQGTAAVTLVYERSFEEDSAIETLIYNITVK